LANETAPDVDGKHTRADVVALPFGKAVTAFSENLYAVYPTTPRVALVPDNKILESIVTYFFY